MAARNEARDETVAAFREAVNMTPARLGKWLATDESKSVGQSDGGESVRHASSRRVVKLLHTKKGNLTEGIP
ncbi:DUF3140 domain-containing protein [Streptomyces sp. NPDC048508]|uniref:DUF3140 domain-containing protein n=1 Tax=Streptomyces sp. NPDC048508 TaxID=3365561 RepID=UPI00371C444D